MKTWPIEVSEASAGYYKAKIADWTVRENESGSKSISMILWLMERYDFGDKDRAPSWESWRTQVTETNEPYCFFVYSDQYFYKKKKGTETQTLDARMLDQLKKAGILNDEGFNRFASDPPESLEIIVQVRYEAAKGEYQDRVVGDRIFPITHVPTLSNGLANKATTDRLAELEAQFGAQVRALTFK